MIHPLASESIRRKLAEANARRRHPATLLDAAELDLTDAARRKVLDRLREMPILHRNTYLRALAGGSPQSAIEAFCSMCVGWEEVPETCTDPACPLYPYRPQ